MTQPRAVVPAGLDATLALVRHGRSTWIDEGRFQGRADPPLAATGEDQAAALAARFAGGGLDPLPATAPLALWTSPLERARRTAAHLAALDGWPEPRPLEALVEIGQGAWEGEAGTEVARRWPAELAAWRRDPTNHHAPGGEPLVEAEVRVRAGLTTVLEGLAAAVRAEAPPLPPGSRSPVPGYGAPPAAQPWVVVVAHDGILRLALLTLLDLPPASFWRFPFILAGLSVVEIHGGAPMLRAHNLAEHLAPLTTPAEAPRPGAL